jgi:hypothetical protein
MPPRKKSERLTPLETEIMNVLGELSPATAHTVRLLRELAYTTAPTPLNVLVSMMSMVELRQLTPEKLAWLQRMIKGQGGAR